jgi:DNA polymerase III alpha subunit
VGELHHCHGRHVHVCGLMVACRTNRTTTGDLMKFVSLADRTGVIETFLFPDTYQRFGHLTVTHPILAATGVVEPFENGNGFTLRVMHVAPPARRAKARSTPVDADAAGGGVFDGVAPIERPWDGVRKP